MDIFTVHWSLQNVINIFILQNDLTAILEIKLGPAIKMFNAITAVRLRHS